MTDSARIKSITTQWGNGLFEKFKTYTQVKVFEVLPHYISSDLVFILNKRSLRGLCRESWMKDETVIKVLLELVDLGILTKTNDGNYMLPSEYVKVEVDNN